MHSSYSAVVVLDQKSLKSTQLTDLYSASHYIYYRSTDITTVIRHRIIYTSLCREEIGDLYPHKHNRIIIDYQLLDLLVDYLETQKICLGVIHISRCLLARTA